MRNPALEALLVTKYQQRSNHETWHSINEAGGSVQHLDWLTDDERKTFKTAFEINQREIVQQAADRQPYITQSQSLNVFFAPGSDGLISAKYLHDVHFSAWEQGVKSMYYLRSDSVLKSADVDVQAKVQKVMDKIIYEECTVCQ